MYIPYTCVIVSLMGMVSVHSWCQPSRTPIIILPNQPIITNRPPNIQALVVRSEPLSEQPSKQPIEPIKPFPLWWLSILFAVFFLGVAFALVRHWRRHRQLAPPVIPDENV